MLREVLFLASLYLSDAHGYTTPHVLRQTPKNTTPAIPSQNQVQHALGPQLSEGASIYFPGSEQYDNATSRWTTYHAPNISLVVEVAAPNDVSAVVRYANSQNLPFIALNRGHGNTETLGNVHHGIEIWLNQMTQVEVADDGDSAQFGGGVYTQNVMDALDAQGKIGATGSCACVGLLGAGLGGGHGRAQGLHGLFVDSIIAANVVLWNGTQINVSNTSHSDLWWGLRGAGHNFGIVTNYTGRVFERPATTWTYTNMVINATQLERVFDILNQQRNDGIAPEMAYRGVVIAWNTSISQDKPVINVGFDYAGPASGVAPYTAPFLALEPISVTSGEVPYPQIPRYSGSGVDDPLCEHGYQNMPHGLYLREYNTTAVRTTFDLFANFSRTNPVLMDGNTSIEFENYANNAVQSVPSDASAFPHRADNHLVLHIARYLPGQADDDAIISWGRQLRDTLQAGQAAGTPLDTYVNYAFGDESLESMYGYEPWRLERLRSLKAAYDPYDKFSFYNPIS